LVGGLTGAIVMLAVVLTLGLLAWAPLGAAGAAVGLSAAFVTVTLGGIIVALLSRGAMPTAGPSSATALILAGLLASMARDPLIANDPVHGVPAMVAAAGLSVMLMGAVQVLMSVLRLGRLAQFVPQPVLAGFMNGVAVLILVSQVPTLLGNPGVHSAGLSAAFGHAVQPAALAIGLATAAFTGLLAWRVPRAPAQLSGLVFGLLLSLAVHHLLPGVPFGDLVGPLPSHLPLPELPLQLAIEGTGAQVWRYRTAILAAGLILGLIGSLEAVLGELALDQALDAQHDTDRLLLALGVANLVIGLFSGLPAVVMRARAMATVNAGGQGRRAALIGAAAFGLMYLLCGPVLALIPKTVLAGIMLTVAFSLADRWTHRLFDQWRHGERSTDLWQSLLIVALVAGLTIGLGFVVGVAAGIAVVLLVFVRNMNSSLLRSRYTAADEPSRRIYPLTQERYLQPVRERIAIFELEGALFFGTAERLAREADALQPPTRTLVLNLRAVGTIDATGAMLLHQLSTRLHQRGISLLLAGVADDHPHGGRLRAFGFFRESPRHDWFPDVDRAVEAAERLLLREGAVPDDPEPVPLAQSTLMQGLNTDQVARLQHHLKRIELPARGTLFRQGDAGNSLYVLTRGSITVIAGDGPAFAQRRYVSFSAGLMLGETAMLDGAGRSATATADTEVELFQLTQPALDALQQEAPELAAQLYRNVAVHLSERLRRATRVRFSTPG
jgi:sulfate permease, SulP family